MTWLLALLIGCAPLEPAHIYQEQDSCKVVIFRRGSYIVQNFDLWINDEAVLKPFKQHTALTLQVPAGDLKLATKRSRRSWNGEREYVITLEPGATYYLQAELEYDFPMTYLGITVSNSEKYGKVKSKLKEAEPQQEP